MSPIWSFHSFVQQEALESEVQLREVKIEEGEDRVNRRDFRIQQLKTKIQLLRAELKESRSKICSLELNIEKQVAENESLKLRQRKFIVQQLDARDKITENILSLQAPIEQQISGEYFLKTDNLEMFFQVK